MRLVVATLLLSLLVAGEKEAARRFVRPSEEVVGLKFPYAYEIGHNVRASKNYQTIGKRQGVVEGEEEGMRRRMRNRYSEGENSEVEEEVVSRGQNRFNEGENREELRRKRIEKLRKRYSARRKLIFGQKEKKEPESNDNDEEAGDGNSLSNSAKEVDSTQTNQEDNGSIVEENKIQERPMRRHRFNQRSKDRKRFDHISTFRPSTPEDIVTPILPEWLSTQSSEAVTQSDEGATGRTFSDSHVGSPPTPKPQRRFRNNGVRPRFPGRNRRPEEDTPPKPKFPERPGTSNVIQLQPALSIKDVKINENYMNNIITDPGKQRFQMPTQLPNSSPQPINNYAAGPNGYQRVRNNPPSNNQQGPFRRVDHQQTFSITSSEPSYGNKDWQPNQRFGNQERRQPDLKYGQFQREDLKQNMAHSNDKTDNNNYHYELTQSSDRKDFHSKPKPEDLLDPSEKIPSPIRKDNQATRVPGSTQIVKQNNFPYQYWSHEKKDLLNANSHKDASHKIQQNSVHEELASDVYETQTAVPSFDLMHNPFENEIKFSRFPEIETVITTFTQDSQRSGHQVPPRPHVPRRNQVPRGNRVPHGHQVPRGNRVPHGHQVPRGNQVPPQHVTSPFQRRPQAPNGGFRNRFRNPNTSPPKPSHLNVVDQIPFSRPVPNAINEGINVRSSGFDEVSPGGRQNNLRNSQHNLVTIPNVRISAEKPALHTVEEVLPLIPPPNNIAMVPHHRNRLQSQRPRRRQQQQQFQRAPHPPPSPITRFAQQRRRQRRPGLAVNAPRYQNIRAIDPHHPSFGDRGSLQQINDTSHFDVKYADGSKSQARHPNTHFALSQIKRQSFDPTYTPDFLHAIPDHSNREVHVFDSSDHRQSLNPPPPANFYSNHPVSRVPFRQPQRNDNARPQSFWDGLSNFDFSVLNPFSGNFLSSGFDEYDRLDPVSAAIPASVLVPGGLAVLGAGLGMFYFNFVWYPTPIVRARLIDMLMETSRSDALTEDQQRAITDVSKVYSALSDIGSTIANVSNSSSFSAESLRSLETENLQSLEEDQSLLDCKNRIVCQTYSEFEELFSLTELVTLLLGDNLKLLDQDLLLEYLQAADRGHSLADDDQTCQDYYQQCPLPVLSVKDSLKGLMGLAAEENEEMER